MTEERGRKKISTPKRNIKDAAELRATVIDAPAGPETHARLVICKVFSCKFPGVVAPGPTFRARVGHVLTPPLLPDHKQELRQGFGESK